MEFSIENRPVFTTLHLKLKRGESFRAEAGAMVAMSNTLSLEAKSSGKGVFGTLKAAVSGEAFFASLFSAESGDGELLLAPAGSGDIIKYDMTGRTIFAQGGSYLAGSPDLKIEAKGSVKALFSGEGLFLQRISGEGMVFLNSYGAVIERELQAGEHYVVDTGHIVAFEESVRYSLRKAAKGLFSSFASGEGLVAEYEGPGKIWLQTRNLPAFANLLAKFIPSRSK